MRRSRTLLWIWVPTLSEKMLDWQRNNCFRCRKLRSLLLQCYKLKQLHDIPVDWVGSSRGVQLKSNQSETIHIAGQTTRFSTKQLGRLYEKKEEERKKKKTMIRNSVHNKHMRICLCSYHKTWGANHASNRCHRCCCSFCKTCTMDKMI